MQLLTGALWGSVLATSAGGFGPFLEEGDATSPVEITGELADTGIAACDHGVLRDGVQLPEMQGLVTRWSAERAWGTPQLIDTIIRGAEAVQWLVPHADPLTVGDLSRERGGYLYGHKSHREGLDADIGIYLNDARQSINAFDDVDAANFDVASTWILIRSMLETGMVERILLDESLIQLVRLHLRATGELSETEIERIFPRTPEERYGRDGVVHHAPGHRNHLHLRVVCDAG